MKRFLSVGEGYGLSRGSGSPAQPQKDKVFSLLLCTPKVTGMLLLVAFFCFFSADRAEAQGGGRAITEDREVSGREAYRIGDKLPRNFAIGYDPFDPTKKVSMSDLKGKAVILDAWATWCGSCINKFPVLDSLSKMYGDHLQIVLVGILGRDTPEKIRAFVENYLEKSPAFSLTFVVEEPKLNDSFTFGVLPHYIWIDPNRRIRAFTGADAFRDENIKRLMAGSPVHVPVKKR